jgi:hypothetical protein
MRRALRWIINGLTILSLLLSVASVTLWVASYRYRCVLRCEQAKSQAIYWELRYQELSLEPSCLFVEHGTGAKWNKTMIVFGPQGEAIERMTDPPRTTARRWHVEDKPGRQWDGSLDRRFLRWERLRFAIVTQDTFGGDGSRLVVIPLYAVMLLTALPPAWRGWRWLRRRRELGGRGFEVEPRPDADV